MNRPVSDNRDSHMPAAAAGTISRSKSMTVIINRTRLQLLDTRIRAGYTRLHDRLQSTPLAYKLSFFITVLVVSSMTLLGIILIQQQTGQLQDQISEQGHTLVQLMAESAKEPLLADDERALDAITSGFSNNGSVLGTAIASLDGEIISRAGILHEENNLLNPQHHTEDYQRISRLQHLGVATANGQRAPNSHVIYSAGSLSEGDSRIHPGDVQPIRNDTV